MISQGIQDAILQFDLLISNMEKQGTNGDLVQAAGNIKVMLPFHG